MTEFWLISAPGDKTCQQTWDTLNSLTSKQNSLSVNHKFHVPDLKVGTLDVLVGLSDDLGKVDTYCESIARKVAGYLGDVLEDQRAKLQENLLANGNDLVTYLTRFQWDLAQYPIKQNLKAIVDYIANKVSKIDADLKLKASAYNSIKGSLQSLERKSTGSLITRALAGLVKKDDFVHNSDYLVTLLVVVPKVNYRDWYVQYESLTAMVVPRSSKLIFEDNENGLFTVTLFQKVVGEYKRTCREKKFVVRDFVYNEEELIADKNELSKLASDKKKEFGTLVRWLKVNFSEAFTAWIHIKALRVFVESVLRYGLPVNFQGMLLQPQKRTSKRLREVLAQLYAGLDSSGGHLVAGAEILDIPGLTVSEVDYYPYVCYQINVDMLDGRH